MNTHIPTLSTQALSGIADLCERYAYTDGNLRALWGSHIDQAIKRNNAAPALDFVHGVRAAGAPVATIAALFLLASQVPTAQAQAVFGGELLYELLESGLLEIVSAQDHTQDAEPVLRSSLALVPYSVPNHIVATCAVPKTLWLFSDHGTLNNTQVLTGDFVLGLGGAGKTLADITPRAQFDTALDLGTGCGIQALLLAHHVKKVVATDTSARALELARLNARLANIDNIETRLGSMFAPVQNDQFDLVVSNPPFVITPQGETATLEYRDAGYRGDSFMQELLAKLPTYLKDGGQAALLGNWEHYSDTERTNPSSWVSDTATHVTIIERDALDPVAYAETWIRDGGVPRASAQWNSDTRAWLADFANRGVTQVGFGWVRLHKATVHNTSVDPGSGTQKSAVTAPVTEPSLGAVAPVRDFSVITGALGANPNGIAAHLDLRLELLEWLAGASADELLDTHYVRAEGLVEHRHFTPGEESPSSITVEQGIGFARTFSVDSALAGFIGVADGSLSLRAILAALAELLDVDLAALQAQVLQQLHELVPAGIVFPQSP